jgi:glutamine amidotransferase
MQIEIIDLGINNLDSLKRALSGMYEIVDIKVRDSGQEDYGKPNLIVLPGVGNFGAAANSLREKKLDKYIKEQHRKKIAILGICLGMQLLLNKSEESSISEGLGLIPGLVERLDSSNGRVPNVGWSEINFSTNKDSRIKINDEANFYFTHSYFANVDEEFVVATSSHGTGSFPAIIQNGLALGIQFHPEKSGLDGRLFLKAVIQDLLYET